MVEKKPNNYIIEGDIVKVELRRRNKESLWAIIDLDDLDKITDFPYSWHSTYSEKTKSFYAHSTSHKEKRMYYLHILIANPENTKGIYVDHINHNTLDNRKENLRLTNKSQNSSHKNGMNKNNVSGYRNVAYIRNIKKKPYHVQLMVNGKNTVLGKFSDVDEAGIFAEKMRNELYGEYAGEGNRIDYINEL